MRRFIVLLFFLLLICPEDIRADETDEVRIDDAMLATARSELHRFCSDFLRLYPQRLAQIATQFDHIIGFSLQYRVDHLLVIYIASVESSLRPDRVGEARGERGYMQVHGRQVTRGFDLSNPIDQWHAGIRRLRAAFDACRGDLRGAIRNYGTGSCTGYTKRGRRKMNRRYRQFLRIRERYRSKGGNRDRS